jgi:hypothetical protein
VNLLGLLDAGELERAVALLEVADDIGVGPSGLPADMAREVKTQFGDQEV